MRYDVSLVPAYGRDYKSNAEILRDWTSEKDFVETRSGQYYNRQSARDAGHTAVCVRYASLRKVVVFRVDAAPLAVAEAAAAEEAKGAKRAAAKEAKARAAAGGVLVRFTAPSGRYRLDVATVRADGSAVATDGVGMVVARELDITPGHYRLPGWKPADGVGDIPAFGEIERYDAGEPDAEERLTLAELLRRVERRDAAVRIVRRKGKALPSVRSHVNVAPDDGPECMLDVGRLLGYLVSARGDSPMEHGWTVEYRSEREPVVFSWAQHGVSFRAYVMQVIR